MNQGRMVLADTSIWVDHLRTGGKALAGLLDAGMVLTHPFVTSELALGNLHRRELVLDMLADLPKAAVATDGEILQFIERHALNGRGIGYVGVHLLAAVRLTDGAALWTRDKRLHAIADELGLAMAKQPPNL